MINYFINVSLFFLFCLNPDDEKELGTFQAFSVLLGPEIPKLSKVTLESNRKESFFLWGGLEIEGWPLIWCDMVEASL